MKKPNKWYFEVLRYVYIIFFIAVFSNANASEQLQFQQISVSEGLKSSRVNSITQDHIGYMWFATFNGVEKFTGTESINYTLSSDASHFNRENIIRCITYTKNFDILCGTRNGNVYQYNRLIDNFEPLQSSNEWPNMYDISIIYEEEGSGLWIGDNQGLYFYDTHTKHIKKINEIKSQVWDVYNTHDAILWVASTKGLFALDIEKQEVCSIKHNDQSTEILEKTQILKITPSKKHTFTLCTALSEVFCINTNGNKISLDVNKQFTFNEKYYRIRDCIDAPQGQKIIAFDGLGLIQTDHLLNTTQIINSNDDDEQSLSSTGIYNLFYSNDSILWVGTYGGGVNYSDPHKKPFEIVKHIPYLESSLRNNTVNSIIEDDHGNIWYGTKKGISIYTISDQTWEHIPAIKESAINPVLVMHMDKDNDGNIWVATYGSGLLKIDGKTHNIETFSTKQSGYHNLETDHLFYVLIDDDNFIWAGGIWGSTTRINTESHSNQKVNVSNIRTFFNDGDQVIVGTLAGIFMVNKKTLEVTRPTNYELIEARVVSIEKHPSQDLIYLGTDTRGILEWNRTTHSIERKTVDNGLPTDFIRSFHKWNDSELWVGTTKGISLYNIDESIFKNYTTIDGLSGSECTENAVWRLSSDKLVFGSNHGVTIFAPEMIQSSKQRSIPILTDIKLQGKSLTISNDGPLHQNINIQEEIYFKYNQNSLSISFGAIGFSSPEKIKFRWRLSGLEQHWNNAANVREAIYSKLQPGSYQFQVMATDDDGQWQDEVKTINITIDPPFWKSPIAYIIFIVLIGGFLYWVFKYYRSQINERHYKEKQQFFISIAHDLRTPLSLIKLPVEKMIHSNNTDKIDTENIHIVKRNVDRLTNLVNQLLDFQKADLHKMSLQVENHELINYLRQHIDVFTPLAREKKVVLELINPEQNINLWFDKGKVDKIIYNLLSNALKYTLKDGKVIVSVNQDSKKCQISIQDNGEGIPKNQQKQIFQPYFRATNAINSLEVGSGVGLVLTKQLVELHHGTISFQSEYGKGSTFDFTLRNGKSHFKTADFAKSDKRHIKSTPSQPIETEFISAKNSQGKPQAKLLIVEDHPELLHAIAHELDSEFEVFTAENGQMGIQVAKEKQPDIIISDVMMPIMNGHQLCVRLKRDLSTCHIPIILLTALDSANYKREGLEYGADAYLEKPFDLLLLKAQIKNLIRSRVILKQKFLSPNTNIAEASPSTKDQIFLEKAQNYILKNLKNESLSVQSLAEIFGMSQPVLYRKVKAITDLSPQQFILNIKLKEASRIMREEHINISETAFKVGFSDPKYFSQAFKKNFGMTPSTYMKQSMPEIITEAHTIDD